MLIDIFLFLLVTDYLVAIGIHDIYNTGRLPVTTVVSDSRIGRRHLKRGTTVGQSAERRCRHVVALHYM